MAYPTKYTRQFDFQSYQNANPTRPLPGDKVNADYNFAEQSIDEIVEFLKGFSRSDGLLANESVGVDQLSAEVLALIATGDTEFPSSQVTYDSASSGLTSSTVQDAIDELAGAAGGISDIVEDTTPQLGGNLDLNGFVITGLVIGTNVQAYDADLTTWAGLTPSANAQSLVTAANYAAMRALLDLEAGTDFYSIAAADAAFQPKDADLTTLASPTAWRVFYSNGTSTITELALGADGTFLKSNGASAAPTFATPAGSGDVSKVGTPVDNQIGVWTGDGTIEGDTALTFDTSTDTLAIAASGTLAFGAVAILDDAAGTMTLQNIDALDATTEATIEAAIDTLANLTSIQGVAFTFGAYAATLLNNANEAAFKAAVNLEAGVDFQAYDATLAALAAYNTNGLLTQTAADTFTGRTVTGTANQITVTNGDGVAGNPTLSLPADVIIPTVLTAPNTGLHILDTNASHDLIVKPGSDLTADRTLTVTTGDADRTLTISASATVSQDYSTTGNPQFATIELGAASDTTLSRSAAGVLAVEGKVVRTAGKETIWIPAGSMVPKATNGAAAGTYDSGANDITLYTLDFDTTTQEYAQFSVAMPKGWNESTVTFVPIWTNTGGASAETVVWSLAGLAVSDDDPLNGTFGTVQTSSDTWLAQNDAHIGPESAAITIGGTPAENDMVIFEVSRVVASDNMAGDARLIGIKLFITYNAENDA